MNTGSLQLIENAFYNGAYSVAFDLSSALVHAGNTAGAVLLYRALAEVGMTNLTDFDPNAVKANISFAFQHLCEGCVTVASAEERLDDGLTMCLAIANTLKSNFDMLDEELRQQYQGSTGISFNSDDPAEKAKQDRERAFNNNINTQRNNLRGKYENIVATLFEIALQTTMQTSIIATNKYKVSLSFIEHLETVIHRVDEVTAKETKTFIAGVKKARNEHYWAENAELRDALTSEKYLLEKKIATTIAEQRAKCEEARVKAGEAKERAIKERKRYSLFNFKDRQPQNEIIAKARAIIKKCKEEEKQLSAGICALCDSDRKRIEEIIAELGMQR